MSCWVQQNHVALAARKSESLGAWADASQSLDTVAASHSQAAWRRSRTVTAEEKGIPEWNTGPTNDAS